MSYVEPSDPEIPDRRAFCRHLLALLAAPSIASCASLSSNKDSRFSHESGDERLLALIDPVNMMDLEISLVGVFLRRNLWHRNTRIVELAAPQRGTIVITLRPQHIAEQTFPQDSSFNPPTAYIGEVKAVYSNPTRLAFRLIIPPDINGDRILELDEHTLDHWTDYIELVQLPIGATSDDINSTHIELPSGLFLTLPSVTSEWVTPHSSKNNNDPSELWHVLLQDKHGESKSVSVLPTKKLDLRDPTFDNDDPKTVPTIPLGPQVRQDIVEVFGQLPPTGSSPVSSILALSSIGGWLDLTAHRNTMPASGNSLVGWEQRVAYGRDQLVRIVRDGYLYPYGIHVHLVTRTERRMQVASKDSIPPPTSSGQCVASPQPTHMDPSGIGAFLRSELIIERVTTMPAMSPDPDMPFAGLHLDQPCSPALDLQTTWNRATSNCEYTLNPVGVIAGTGLPDATPAFWVTVADQHYRFNLAGQDQGGMHHTDIHAAAIFVPSSLFQMSPHSITTAMALIDAAWQRPDVPNSGSDVNQKERQVDLGGRRVTVVPTNVGKFASTAVNTDGKTTLHTHTIELVRGATLSTTFPADLSQAPFYARAYLMEVEHPALSTLTGQAKKLWTSYRKVRAAIDDERALPVLDPTNPIMYAVAETLGAGTFLSAVDDKLDGIARIAPKVQFIQGAAKNVRAMLDTGIIVGGLATDVALISKAELNNFKNIAQMNVGEIFEKVINAKLFGVLDLEKIFKEIKASSLDTLPQLKIDIQIVPDVKIPNHINATYKWNYKWLDGADPVLVFEPSLTIESSIPKAAEMRLFTYVNMDIIEKTTSYGGTVSLTNFTIELPEAKKENKNYWISIGFPSVEFAFGEETKTHKAFDLAQPIFTFGADFQFLQALGEELKTFFDAPSIISEVNTEFAKFGQIIALPEPINISPSFVIEKIQLSASVLLGFLDQNQGLRVDFALNSRSKPALMSINGFAGAAFVHVILKANEPELVEVSFEFGGSYEANFGYVAHGSACVMAGIYFGIRTIEAKTSTALEGYVRAAGEIHVLIIGGVNLTIYVGLRYIGSSAYGLATITVSVRYGFVKISQSFTASYTFAGASPTVQAHALRAPFNPSIPPATSMAVKFSDLFDIDPSSSASWENYWDSFVQDNQMVEQV